MTFETKCWEEDWQRLLAPGVLAERIGRLARPFDERVLFVNNVRDPKQVSRIADRLVSQEVLTKYYFVSDVIDEALDRFRLRPSDLGDGYWYSSAELSGLHLCDTRALLHFSSDTAMAHVHDWVTPGLDRLDKRVSVVCPVWNGRLLEARVESTSQVGPYLLGAGFSDQCYLVMKEPWLTANFSLDHPHGERYPSYGGPLFERRADAWLRHSGLVRAVDTRATYIHPA